MKRLIKDLASDAEVWQALGVAHTRLADFAAARDAFAQACLLAPARLELQNFLAAAELKLGHLERSLECYQRVLKKDPGNVNANFGISAISTLRDPKAPQLQLLEKRLTSSKASDEERIRAGFALGQYWLNLGNQDKAFGFYALANALAAKQRPYDSQADLLQMNQELFNQETFARVDLTDLTQAPQFFVVGMSRSGKSLIASLVGCHPTVDNQDESRDFFEFASKLHHQQSSTQAVKNWLHQQSPERLKALAQNFLDQNAFVEGRKSLTTLPENLGLLGYLSLLFPKTPIIFCTRDPEDLGLCSYFKHYQKGNGYSYDLYHLGQHIRLTEALINHWMKVLPNPMLKIRYEDLVSQPSAVSRGVYEFLGLDWQSEYFEPLQRYRDHAEHMGPAQSFEVPTQFEMIF